MQASFETDRLPAATFQIAPLDTFDVISCHRSQLAGMAPSNAATRRAIMSALRYAL
jgi:hypothetical protein